MSTDAPVERFLDLGAVHLDALSGEMRHEGRRIRLRPRTTALLAHLMRNADRVVPKDELMRSVWRDTVVTEDSLVQCVKEIRHAFAGTGHDCIRTVPRQGYAFLTPAATSTADPYPAAAEARLAGLPGRAYAPRGAQLPVSATGSIGDPVLLDLMLRGWQLFTTYTADGHAQARAVYEAVIERVPRHVEALTLLGWIHWFDAIEGRSADPDASFRQACDLARVAVDAGGDTGPPHALMGKVLLWQLRHAEALACFGRAVASAPGYGYMHFHLGEALMWCGHAEAALHHLDRAMAIDADEHGVFLTIRGMACWMAGDMPRARAALDSAGRRHPTYAWTHGMLAVLHHESGDAAAARHEALAGRTLNPRFGVRFAEDVLPFLLPTHRARVAAAWRAAGMPDSAPEARRSAAFAGPGCT